MLQATKLIISRPNDIRAPVGVAIALAALFVAGGCGSVDPTRIVAGLGPGFGLEPAVLGGLDFGVIFADLAPETLGSESGAATDEPSQVDVGLACWSGRLVGHVHKIEGFAYGLAVGASVRVIDDASGQEVAATSTDQDGYFELHSNWPCGTLSLFAGLGELRGQAISSVLIHENLPPGHTIVVNINVE